MCTAITAQGMRGDVFFGRTMDFSYPLDPALYVLPKGYKWNNALRTHRIENRYTVMGIGQDISPLVLADGMNEAGFAAAVLYFPGYAQYDGAGAEGSGRLPIAALELVNFLLGQCGSVGEASAMLEKIRIVGAKDAVTGTVAPLHWILADKGGRCATVEKTAEGLGVMDNAAGVLSNSPDFGWHMTNLRNYMNVAPEQRRDADWGPVQLHPFGQGGGTFGLPGDFTPPSRFVRAAYLKSHTPLPAGRDEAVVTCFHILENVSIPKGAVITERGTDDFTQYTAFMDLTDGTYFIRSCTNSEIVTARLEPGRDYGTRALSLGKLARPVKFGSL